MSKTFLESPGFSLALWWVCYFLKITLKGESAADSSIKTSWIAGLDAAGLGESLGAGTDLGEVWEQWEELDGGMGLCLAPCPGR